MSAHRHHHQLRSLFLSQAQAGWEDPWQWEEVDDALSEGQGGTNPTLPVQQATPPTAECGRPSIETLSFGHECQTPQEAEVQETGRQQQRPLNVQTPVEGMHLLNISSGNCTVAAAGGSLGKRSRAGIGAVTLETDKGQRPLEQTDCAEPSDSHHHSPQCVGHQHRTSSRVPRWEEQAELAAGNTVARDLLPGLEELAVIGHPPEGRTGPAQPLGPQQQPFAPESRLSTAESDGSMAVDLKSPGGPEGISHTEPATAAPQQRPRLSPEQQAALDAVQRGDNVFITGQAGVGKSFLVETIVKALREQMHTVAVTASTGIAAVNVKGTTIHSFAGIRKGEEEREELARRAWYNTVSREAWQTTTALLLDEVSMISANLFEKLGYVARVVKGYASGGGMPDKLHPSPFGGIQLIAVGDFHQLPPVSKGHPRERFAFEAPLWEAMNFKPVVLKTVFRQADAAFIQLLNEVRTGHITRQTEQVLMSLKRPLDQVDGVIPTVLYPTRKDVATENRFQFDKLQEEEVVFHCEETGKDQHRLLLKDCQASMAVSLKVGAQVMMLANIDFAREIANGSRGVVIGFARRDAMNEDTPVPGTPVPDMQQKLAQEATKSGQHDSAGDVKGHQAGDKSARAYRCMEGQEGQHSSVARASKMAYDTAGQPVARELQRAMSNEQDGSCAFLETVQKSKWRRNNRRLPVVRFANGAVEVVSPFCWTVERNKQILASRTQIPLMLAWAVTVHKSQGMTLDRTRLDLRGVFEPGMAYVALSRCRSLEGIELIGFVTKKIVCSRKVSQFYSELESRARNPGAWASFGELDGTRQELLARDSWKGLERTLKAVARDCLREARQHHPHQQQRQLLARAVVEASVRAVMQEAPDLLPPNESTDAMLRWLSVEAEHMPSAALQFRDR